MGPEGRSAGHTPPNALSRSGRARARWHEPWVASWRPPRRAADAPPAGDARGGELGTLRPHAPGRRHAGPQSDSARRARLLLGLQQCDHVGVEAGVRERASRRRARSRRLTTTSGSSKRDCRRSSGCVGHRPGHRPRPSREVGRHARGGGARAARRPEHLRSRAGCGRWAPDRYLDVLPRVGATLANATGAAVRFHVLTEERGEWDAAEHEWAKALRGFPVRCTWRST